MSSVHIRWNVLGVIVGSSMAILILYKLVDVSENKAGHNTYRITGSQQPKFLNPSDKQTRGIKSGSSTKTRKQHVRKLMELSFQSLLEANMYIRSSKARTPMIRAINLFKSVLKEFDIHIPSRKQRPNSTCPEIYHGTSFGYPLFHNGFEMQNCKKQVPIEDLISVVILCKEPYITTYDIDRMVRSIQSYNNTFSVAIALRSAQGSGFTKQFGNLKIVQFNVMVSPGAILNKFASSVTTKYTLIARDLLKLDHDSFMNRLVMEIETLNATAVGGATRDETGHWRKGCYQMVYQNYTLVLEEGYAMSLRECIRCDFIEGPFLVRTETLKRVKFDEHITQSGLLEDFFLRLQQDLYPPSFVCPDAMFYVGSKSINFDSNDWKLFARKWNLRRILLPGQEINIGCPIDYKCLFWKGFAVSPCCLEELDVLVKLIMLSCSNIGALCELQEGTLLGAVKLNKVLPWERDADITFLSSNFSAISFMSSIFKIKGYEMHIEEKPVGTEDGIPTGGRIVISSKHWHVEMYGQHDMDSMTLLRNGESPSKVLLNDQWVNAPRNPGLYVRNRYGYRVYAHSEHWMDMEQKSGWSEYATDTFLACSQPGYHNCLDRYNGDGNLQFNSPAP